MLKASSIMLHPSALSQNSADCWIEGKKSLLKSRGPGGCSSRRRSTVSSLHAGIEALYNTLAALERLPLRAHLCAYLSLWAEGWTTALRGLLAVRPEFLQWLPRSASESAFPSMIDTYFECPSPLTCVSLLLESVHTFTIRECPQHAIARQSICQSFCQICQRFAN